VVQRAWRAFNVSNLRFLLKQLSEKRQARLKADGDGGNESFNEGSERDSFFGQLETAEEASEREKLKKRLVLASVRMQVGIRVLILYSYSTHTVLILYSYCRLDSVGRAPARRHCTS
jgi:hypothetical protein